MKKLIFIICLIFLSTFLTGCTLLKDTPLETLGNRIDGIISNPFNDTAKEHPENNLREFLACLQKQNFVSAREFVSEKVQDSLNEEFLKLMPVGPGFNLSKVQFAVDKDKKTDPNKAFVYYRFDKEPEGSLGQKATLVKEAGVWKVFSFGEFDDY